MEKEVKPYNTVAGKKEEVTNMFNNVAGTYDFLNHFLSLGIDKLWRKKLVKLMKQQQPKQILDVATGTADLAITMLKLSPEKITGIDISENMLAVGRKKIKEKNIANIELLQADSENLPFDINSFDAVTASFGVRNFENLIVGLGEMRRVLKDGGKTYILEFSKPKNRFIRAIYFFYFCSVLPFIGKIISKDKNAYSYLPESVKNFPDGKKFVELLQYCNYKNIQCIPLTFGISTIYIAEK